MVERINAVMGKGIQSPPQKYDVIWVDRKPETDKDYEWLWKVLDNRVVDGGTVRIKTNAFTPDEIIGERGIGDVDDNSDEFD